MKIDVYSHALKVTDVITDRDLQAMLSFCKPLIEYGFEKKGKKFVPKGLRTYAAATRNRREFSFHRNQLAELMSHLIRQHGYVERLIPITHHKVSPDDYPVVEFDVCKMHDPRPIQVGVIDYVLDTVNPAYDPIIKMVTLQTGQGKALRASTPVRTASLQWKAIGDLKVGDRILAADGTPTIVIGHYPQGLRQLYRVTFEDGRSVDADAEHLWRVHSSSGWDTLTTAALIDLMDHQGESFSIPLYKPSSEQKDISMNAIAKYIHSKGERNGTHVRATVLAKGLAFHVRAVGGKAKVTDLDDGMSSITVELKPKVKRLSIESIELIDEDEAVCIAVAHPDKLFVVQDFIVTHNTFIAQYCMNQLKRRTVIHFKGGYVERWKGDLEETFNFKRGEFLIVRGSKDMIALQQMALDDTLKAKVIIITSATMRDYIKDYEESNGHSKVYPIKPIDFYPKLHVGFRVTDELHQEFHNNYRIDLYTHVPKSLGLSATMTSSDRFKNKVYDIAYPIQQRNDGGGYNVYIGVVEVLYQMDQDVRIRYMGAQGYSHTTYEESIMRHKGLLKNYLKIVEHAIYNRFVQHREEGQKALVFFARVDMCTLFTERLKKLYPELEVVRYVGSEGDAYEDILDADITVSTVGSAGTAIDIKNLRCTFMTTAIDSRQSNEQVLGRTRPLKDWPDVTPEFVYFTCMEIDQHVKYSTNKKQYFRHKVVYHRDLMAKYMLTTHG